MDYEMLLKTHRSEGGLTQIRRVLPDGKEVWEVTATRFDGTKVLCGIMHDGTLWMYDPNAYKPKTIPLGISKEDMLVHITKAAIKRLADAALSDGVIDWDEMSLLGINMSDFLNMESDIRGANWFPCYASHIIENPDQTFERAFFMEDGCPSLITTKSWYRGLIRTLSGIVNEEKLTRLIYRYAFSSSEFERETILHQFSTKLFNWQDHRFLLDVLARYQELVAVRELFNDLNPRDRAIYEEVKAVLEAYPRDLNREVITFHSDKTSQMIFGLSQTKEMISPLGVFSHFDKDREGGGWIPWTEVKSVQLDDKTKIWTPSKKKKTA